MYVFVSDFGPRIFLVIAPKFMDLIFKIQHISNHGAKFHDGRLRDIRDRVAEKSAAKHKPIENYHSRWTNNNYYYYGQVHQIIYQILLHL